MQTPVGSGLALQDYAGFWPRSLAALLDNFVWVFFYLWFYVWIVGGALGDKAVGTVVMRRGPRAVQERTA
jgi:hypothetical protein